jgi:DNA-binding transcriptional LysR family regulator
MGEACSVRCVDLRLVEYFVAVVDHGTITKAAESLYIAQPSLSQAIRALERQLGVELFDRSGRQLTLTSDGEAFAGPARGILADAAKARTKVQAVRDLASGRLEISVLANLAIDPLPALTSRLLTEHPGLRITVLDPGSPAGVIDQVRRGRAELGLTELSAHDERLQTHELWDQEIALVMPPVLAAGLPNPVPLDEVDGVPLVMEFSDPSGRRTVDIALRGFTEQVAVECVHRQAIWDLVMHGAGAAFLPRRLAETQLRDVVVRSTHPPIAHTIGLVRRPGPLSPAASSFLDLTDAVREESR